MAYFLRMIALVLLTAAATLLPPVHAQDNTEDPVDLQADRLVHDDAGQSVTASGDVVLVQAGRTVRADEITYNIAEDTVTATGNVKFTDSNGDTHYADRAAFNNALKDGFVERLRTLLADGSRFKASNGRHINGRKTVMKDAFYTPCDVCEDTPDADPLWQIRASRVEHDKDSKTVAYRNARFEVKGVPVAWFPYFVHPDGSVKRKSGFLTPSAGYKSDLGAFVQNSYYWSVAPHRDITVGMTAMTRAAPLGFAQWRERWNNASLMTDGSFTYSERIDNIAGENRRRSNDLRGHIAADGLWDMNNKWRSGIKLGLSSDDQYLRQYDLDSRDVLENRLYAERFSGRNYAVARFTGFQDLRIEEEQEDQPHILPEIQAGFLGEPGSVPVIAGAGARMRPCLRLCAIMTNRMSTVSIRRWDGRGGFYPHTGWFRFWMRMCAAPSITSMTARDRTATIPLTGIQRKRKGSGISTP